MKQIACLLLAVSAQAAVITFQGSDPGVGPGGVRPVSDAARSSFLAAVAGNSPSTLTFETIPAQYSDIINLTTMTLFQVGTINEFGAGVNDTGGDNTLGYNTTPGGSHFLRIVPQFGIGTAGARLVFNSPVEFFGAYYTALGTAAGALSVQFNNGTAQSFPVTGSALGGVNFFGFTTFGQPITEVSMVLTGVTAVSRDVYAIDDITTGLVATFQPTVPEPSTWTMFLGAISALAVARARKPRR